MDDSISRQAAIDALHMHLMYRMGTDSNKKRLDEWINNLPSAKPERKKGEWIPVTNGRGGFECGQCHNYAPSYQDGVEWLSGFCPNCGADMRGEQDDESRSNSNAQTDTRARGMGSTDKSSGI